MFGCMKFSQEATNQKSKRKSLIWRRKTETDPHQVVIDLAQAGFGGIVPSSYFSEEKPTTEQSNSSNLRNRA